MHCASRYRLHHVGIAPALVRPTHARARSCTDAQCRCELLAASADPGDRHGLALRHLARHHDERCRSTSDRQSSPGRRATKPGLTLGATTPAPRAARALAPPYGRRGPRDGVTGCYCGSMSRQAVRHEGSSAGSSGGPSAQPPSANTRQGSGCEFEISRIFPLRIRMWLVTER